MGFYFQLIQYYVENMLPGFLTAGVLYICLLPYRKHKLTVRGLRSVTAREAVLLIFWMFCGGMAMLTLTPWGFHWKAVLYDGFPSTFFQLGDINLIPLQSFDLGAPTRYTLFNILGNIVMFVPFGLFIALLWRGYTWKRALVVGFCITSFIECWQLLVGRAFDIDDLMLNSLGILCGYWLWRFLYCIAPAPAKRFQVRKRKNSSFPSGSEVSRK